MDSASRLDYALFQLTPTRTRYVFDSFEFYFYFFFSIALDALYREAYFYAFFGALCVKI